MTSAPSPHRRVGARRRAEIPPEILRGLHEGAIETATLVEQLAIDFAALLGHALRGSSLPPDGQARAVAAVRAAAHLGVMQRFAAVGAALLAESRACRAPALRDELARHAADTVRSFAAFMIMADEGLAPSGRLEATLPLAADPHAFVREAAWSTLRPFVAADLDAWLERLAPWALHEDPNVRRCAIEAARPRGVWCAHLPLLAREPGRALHLLEPNRAHPSRYVQASVANWLNDASKTRPDWVMDVCARWSEESPAPETAWLVRHATRTLRRKAGGPPSRRERAG